MRYKYLYANKWLDTIPEKLYSDGIDDELYEKDRIRKIVFDKHKYPEDYWDVYYNGKKVYKQDMSNESLFHGFHAVVLCNGDPNKGGKILPSHGPECLNVS